MSESKQPTEVIEAKRFVLCDSDGKIRAELGTDAGGFATLQLHDGEGKARAVVGVGRDGQAGLQFLDADGAPRVLLALDPDDPYIASPTFNLNAKDGKGGITIWVNPTTGGAHVTFRDKDNSVLLELPTPEKANGG
jgi:catechol 2,3-dioxygenase-like lactoylglutathione lyase family enzyme